MQLGEKMKQLRMARNLTQDQLAEKLFVSRQTVSKWELGINQPDIETLQKLAEIFEVSVDELITSNPKQRATPLHKKLLIANILLYVFCTMSVFVLWRFLPAKIPAHYDAQGQIDRYGSSAEVLLHLVSFLVFLVTEIVAYAITHKKYAKSANAISITTLAIFAAYWILIYVLHGLNITDNQNILSLIICLCELLIFVVSIAMHPAICKQNSIMGVRTHLTLSNDYAWNKVNKFAAYVFSVTTAILVALNMILPQMLTMVLSAVGYLPAFAATAIYHKVVATELSKMENA